MTQKYQFCEKFVIVLKIEYINVFKLFREHLRLTSFQKKHSEAFNFQKNTRFS